MGTNTTRLNLYKPAIGEEDYGALVNANCDVLDTQASYVANVKDSEFGALGDGSTDDTIAIQAALDAGIGRVYFPDGTYIVTALTVPSDIILFGNGSTSVIKFLSTDDNSNMLSNDDQTNGNNEIGIYNLKFDGDKTNHSVVASLGRILHFVKCDHITVRDCIFVNSIRYANWFVETDQSLISGNAYDNCYYATMLDDCDNVRVTDNEVSNGEDRGIYTKECSQCVIANNVVDVTTSAGAFIGIELFNAGGTSINNVVSGNFLKKGRISVGTDGEKCSITGNTIISADTYGIELVQSNNSIISGNIIRDSGQDSIFISGSSKVAVTGNTIDSPAATYLGIRVWADSTNATTNSCTITGNTIYNVSGSAGYGIQLRNNAGTEVNDCVIANNTIDTVVDNAIKITNSNNNLIAGNIIRNITAAVEIDLTHGTSSGNRMFNNFTEESLIGTLANDATPSIAGGQGTWLTGGTTTITDIDDGYEGQEIRLIAEHSVTITDGTNIFLNGSANFVMVATDTLSLIQKADGLWYEISRSDNT